MRPHAAALLMTLLAGPAAAEAPPCAPGTARLREGLGTTDEDRARLAELAGEAPVTSQAIRRGGVELQPGCDDRVGVLLPARLDSTWNSQYPSGGNDGLQVAGRGLSTRLRAGVAGRWGVVSAALAPELAWQQNRWFETVPTGQAGARAFQNPWYGDGLDVPQRFGAGPSATASLGQSYLRVDAWGAAVGLSTENLWLGPGLRNAMLLTDNAPGFPHAFLGTARPVETPLGALEALALWGRLDRSRFLASAGGHPWFSALVLTWQPRWVPGLTLGGGRAFVETAASLRRNHGLSILAGPFGRLIPGGNLPENNQVVTGWFRWVMPEAGFELYGEWARDDGAASLEATLRDPGRTQGWVAGFQKLLRAGARTVRVQLEAARLHDVRPPASPSGLPSFYTHGSGVDYTHAGQLLGAAVGPGGDTQRLAVDLLTAAGRVGGFLERTARNEEVYWSRIDPLPGRSSDHDVEVAAGYRQLLRLGELEASLELGLAFRWNRDFQRNEPNWKGGLQLAWPHSYLYW